MYSLKQVPTLVVIPLMFLAGGCSHAQVKPQEPVPVAETAQSVRLNLMMTHFEFNKAALTDLGKSVLKSDAVEIQQNPRLKIQVQGFCDDRGSVAYNLRLGEKRAQSVKRYLETLGITGDRISTESFGKADPLDAANNENAWAMNRRASFVILNPGDRVAAN